MLLCNGKRRFDRSTKEKEHVVTLITDIGFELHHW